ncbi:Uncharacterised protein [Vibrio cholerae]|nr:Uncharacterised protein [Vibrio cholerae]
MRDNSPHSNIKWGKLLSPALSKPRYHRIGTHNTGSILYCVVTHHIDDDPFGLPLAHPNRASMTEVKQ